MKWAQRTDLVYLTVSLPSIKEHTVDLKDDSLEFTCVGARDLLSAECGASQGHRRRGGREVLVQAGVFQGCQHAGTALFTQFYSRLAHRALADKQAGQERPRGGVCAEQGGGRPVLAAPHQGQDQGWRAECMHRITRRSTPGWQRTLASGRTRMRTTSQVRAFHCSSSAEAA